MYTLHMVNTMITSTSIRPWRTLRTGELLARLVHDREREIHRLYVYMIYELYSHISLYI